MGHSGTARILVLGALAFLALSGVAEAKKKAPKLGPVRTASATHSASGEDAIVTATATCPKKTAPVGGGFLSTPASAEATVIVYESQKTGKRSWRASAQMTSDLMGPSTASITAFAYCRSGAPKTVTRSASVPTPQAVQVGPAAAGICPGSRKAVAGGFALGPPAATPSGFNATVLGSLRSGASSWQTEVLSTAIGPTNNLTSYAYCAKQKKAPASRSVASAPNPVDASPSTAVSSCKGKRVAVSGGFSQTGASLSPTGFFIPYESQRAGNKEWRVSAVHGGTVPNTLVSTAYCG